MPGQHYLYAVPLPLMSAKISQNEIYPKDAEHSQFQWTLDLSELAKRRNWTQDINIKLEPNSKRSGVLQHRCFSVTMNKWFQ